MTKLKFKVADSPAQKKKYKYYQFVDYKFGVSNVNGHAMHSYTVVVVDIRTCVFIFYLLVMPTENSIFQTQFYDYINLIYYTSNGNYA